MYIYVYSYMFYVIYIHIFYFKYCVCVCLCIYIMYIHTMYVHLCMPIYMARHMCGGNQWGPSLVAEIKLMSSGLLTNTIFLEPSLWLIIIYFK